MGMTEIGKMLAAMFLKGTYCPLKEAISVSFEFIAIFATGTAEDRTSMFGTDE